MPEDEMTAALMGDNQAQDSSQQDSQAAGLPTDNSQGQVGNSAPANQNAQQGEPKMIEADRFNKLQSFYQKSLQQNREYESKQKYYQQLEQELTQLRNGQNQQQPQAKAEQQGAKYRPDMTADEFAAELKKEFLQDLQTKAQSYNQQQEQLRQQEVEAARVEKYHSRFDQVLSHDPEVDQAALKQWMEENDVWNPIVAYNNVYADVLNQAKESKMRQEVSEKISQNASTRVEGNNKQGSVPPQEVDKSTADAREQAFVNMLRGAP